MPGLRKDKKGSSTYLWQLINKVLSVINKLKINRCALFFTTTNTMFTI